jgi:hypothetical protein
MTIALLLSFAMSLVAANHVFPAVASGAFQDTGEKKQDRKDPDAKPPERGDIVLAKGCIRGGVLESGSLTAPGGGEFLELLTLRLTGEKETLEEIKKEHDGHNDVITGELRTDLPKATRGRTIGNTRITIGVGPSRGMMPEPPPPMPVLKVTEFEHTGIRCR